MRNISKNKSDIKAAIKGNQLIGLCLAIVMIKVLVYTVLKFEIIYSKMFNTLGLTSRIEKQ